METGEIIHIKKWRDRGDDLASVEGCGIEWVYNHNNGQSKVLAPYCNFNDLFGNNIKHFFYYYVLNLNES